METVEVSEKREPSGRKTTAAGPEIEPPDTAPTPSSIDVPRGHPIWDEIQRYIEEFRQQERDAVDEEDE